MHEKHNPCGLDGFAFLEFSGPDEQQLHQQFKDMGFQLTAQHQSQNISLYQQGHIQFIIINAAPHSQAAQHARTHGPGACAMGFKVQDAQAAYQYALAHGATAFEDCEHAAHGLLGIQAIGGSVIYFVDDHHQPFAQAWHPKTTSTLFGNGLKDIDHLTHNVFRGNMDKWAEFYGSIFNFKKSASLILKGK